MAICIGNIDTIFDKNQLICRYTESHNIILITLKCEEVEKRKYKRCARIKDNEFSNSNY